MTAFNINTEVLELSKIGWSESKDDEEIIYYMKTFFKEQHDTEISADLALTIVWVIDDLLTYTPDAKLVGKDKDFVDKQVILDKIRILESYRNKYLNEELENQISLLKSLLEE